MNKNINHYVIFDSSYLGPGYFIIEKVNEQIVKIIKIFYFDRFGLREYYLRAWENSKNNSVITFTLNKDDLLFKPFIAFKKSMYDEIIFSSDSKGQGLNSISTSSNERVISLFLTKDLTKNSNSPYIDISIGSSVNSICFDAMFKELSKIKVYDYKMLDELKLYLK